VDVSLGGKVALVTGIDPPKVILIL
jgi:hypothetical protein